MSLAKTLITVALSAICFAIFTGCSAEAETFLPSTAPHAKHDWPRYLGPHGDGTSREANWKSDWAEREPKKLWEAKIGTGFCTIAVAGGRAITMGHSDGEDTVYAFDAVTGKQLWKHSYKCALIDNLYEGGPNATLTIDGDRVYTLGKEGQLFALNVADGSVAWQASLSELLGVKTPAWGFSSSPLVDGDRVVIDGGRTAAFDKATGKLLWKTDKFKPGYGSVTKFERSGETLLAVLNNEFLLVLKAKDGAELARYPWVTDYDTSACTPNVRGDKIFISTGYGKGCGLFKLVEAPAAEGAANGKLQLDLVYENKKLRNHINNSIFHDGHIYGFDGQTNNSRTCHLVCMDFESGEVRWKERGLGCGSLIIVDGKLLCLSDEGQLVVAPATPDGFKPTAKAEALTGKCWTTPALAHGRIYCRSATGDLVCLDVSQESK